MKIAVWKTGHEIADTVALSLAEGFGAKVIYEAGGDLNRMHFGVDKWFGYLPDAIIGYGILRGMDEVFGLADKYNIPWFNIDRGYFNPGHYDGYYRISYRGTQAKWHDGIPRKPWDGRLEAIRKKPPDDGYYLYCPPTQPVMDFFGIKTDDWVLDRQKLYVPFLRRFKGDKDPIEWDRVKAVITFNSSVGWQALQRGIPVLSDPNHSIIGSYYAAKGVTDLQSLTDYFDGMPDTRLELFESMNAHQFTLDEIKQGKAWSLISHYTSGLATIAEKPLPPMSAPTASRNALKHHFQSNT